MMDGVKLNEEEYRQVLTEYINNYFCPLIDKEIYSLIINRDFEIEVATNHLMKTLGFKDRVHFNQISLKDYNNPDVLNIVFGDKYHPDVHPIFEFYAKKIHFLQQLVFQQAKVIKFVDMLPYNGQSIIYITTYMPIIHKSGEVIAIHSSSIDSYILRFQGHLRKPNIKSSDKEFKKLFSSREIEILFLLANGATQDQIAQILNIARTTVSSIIANQICPKFNIAGANTKILVDAAINAGFYLDMPESLWKPCIIVLNEELLEYPELKETAEREY